MLHSASNRRNRTKLAAITPHRRPRNSARRYRDAVGQFTTLLAAVDAAGLTETLLGKGPFTVFAPTDEAFKRLPAGTVEELLKPQNREKLRTILTYHVIDRGAPLFNDGQPNAIIAIYEVAINALLSLSGESMNSDQQRALRAALRDDRSGNPRDRAFALRRALDETRRHLDGRMDVTRR